jgi:hypothetical protein
MINQRELDAYLIRPVSTLLLWWRRGLRAYSSASS